MGESTGASPAHSGSKATNKALSFGGVAEAYDRARPTYPREAAAWLAGSQHAHLLELGAGTGKLTEQLLALGHRVVATDPLPEMLRHLVARLPDAQVVLATAEHIPMRARSVDTVVGAQSFHWFDLPARCPRSRACCGPGATSRSPGTSATSASRGSSGWVRSSARQEQASDPTNALLSSHLFGYVESSTYRFWQPLDRDRLRDLVRSRSNISTMPEQERERVLGQVDDALRRVRPWRRRHAPALCHALLQGRRPPALAGRGRRPAG